MKKWIITLALLAACARSEVQVEAAKENFKNYLILMEFPLDEKTSIECKDRGADNQTFCTVTRNEVILGRFCKIDKIFKTKEGCE